jgi:hypothetical protein
MFISADTENLYVYETLDHLIHSRKAHNDSLCKIQFASFVLELSDNNEICKIIKDRSGIFRDETKYETKKIVKIIEILLEK